MSIVAKYLSKTTASVIKSRCKLYAMENSTKKKCKLMADALMENTDFRVKTKKGLVEAGSIYYSEFLKFIGQKKTLDFIVKANKYLEVNPNTDDFYKWVLTEVGGNKNELIKYFAFIVQAPHINAHIKLFRKVKGPSFEHIAKDFESLTSRILKLPKESSYPPMVKGINTTINLYHFYVISYFSVWLSENFPADKSMAYFIPFSLNTFYEYWTNGRLAGIKIPKTFFDFNPMSLIRGLLQLTIAPKDPAPFEPSTWKRRNLEDIYLGYLGARFGAGYSENTVFSYDVFVSLFSSDPTQFMRDEFPK